MLFHPPKPACKHLRNKTNINRVQCPPLNPIRFWRHVYAFTFAAAAKFPGLARYLRRVDHLHCASALANAGSSRSWQRPAPGVKRSNDFNRASPSRRIRHGRRSRSFASPVGPDSESRSLRLLRPVLLHARIIRYSRYRHYGEALSIPTARRRRSIQRHSDREIRLSHSARAASLKLRRNAFGYL